MRRITLAALAAAISLFTVPGEAGALKSVERYAEDRGNDFLDLFRLRGGFPREGRGVGLKVRATSLAQIGYVFFDGAYAGLDRRAIGVVDERRREFGLSLLYGSYNEMEPLIGNFFLTQTNSDWFAAADRRVLRNVPHWDDGRRRHLSVGTEIATPLVAFDLGIYPEEAIDFALGIFTIDIFRDDKLRRSEEPRRWEPTTLPIPSEDAPFAEKRARYAPIVEELRAVREAEALAGEQGMTFTTSDGRTLTLEENVAPTPSMLGPGVIEESDAQEAMSLLELLEQGVPSEQTPRP